MSQSGLHRRVFLPLVVEATAAPSGDVPGESYNSLPVLGPATDRLAEQHADLNLALRSYQETNAYLGLVDIGGPADGRAPQLAGLYAKSAFRGIRKVYQVYDWDWNRNSRGGLTRNPAVTLIGLPTQLGETIHTPAAGYTIGDGFQVLVLYASDERITLKYTREDNVIYGYTLHLEGLVIEPRLLELYHRMDAAGRAFLPALRAGQAIGRAKGTEIGVAIRDCGSFMDPRSRKDWWVGN